MENNLLSKINANDINLVNNRFIRKNDVDLNEVFNLKKEFIHYKDDIKEVINKLYKDFSDLSNNIEYNKNEEKYIYYFNFFIKKLISNIKLNEKNKHIQNELINYSNYQENIGKDKKNIIIDNSSNFINDLDKRTFIMRTNKPSTIENYMNINKKDNKILPKKKNY